MASVKLSEAQGHIHNHNDLVHLQGLISIFLMLFLWLPSVWLAVDFTHLQYN